jgi:DNA-binding CsgD family transcriptional regulator
MTATTLRPRYADRQTAELLEEFSAAARGSTGYAAAATALEHAAQICPVGRRRLLALAATDAQLAGQHERARALLARAEAVDEAVAVPDTAVPVAEAEQLAADGHHREAARRYATVVAGLRHAGAVRALPSALARQAVQLAAAGELAAALSVADAAAALAVLTANPAARASALCTRAVVHAIRGETVLCRSVAAQAQALIETDGLRHRDVARPLNLLDVAVGRHREVIERLSLPGAAPADEPDVLEARFRIERGLTAKQKETLLSLTRSAARPVAAEAWRVLGVANPAASSPICFEQALVLHARMDNPFNAARVRLSYGERLRRDGRRTSARAQLRAARDGFAVLGAPAWVARAERELAAADEDRRRPAACPLRSRLTPQEYEVARTVATGLTNRQAAGQLFLSAKTVEFHLGNVFRKLGLRTRTELAHEFPRPRQEDHSG